MSGIDALTLEPVRDSAWLASFLAEHWGAPGIVTRGKLHKAEALHAFRAMLDGEPAGVVSWAPGDAAWEIVSLDSLKPGLGIGTRLLDTAVELARRAGTRRLWLVTTNDNLDALKFYQRRGWYIARVHTAAIATSRRIKPAIPETGLHGIPIRDEIELELPL